MHRFPILGLLISFMFLYMEWGGGNSGFVYNAAYEVFFGAADKSDTFSHPIVLLPFTGLLLLIIALFQAKPNKWLIYGGIALPGILALIILIIGVVAGPNWKMALSALPFLGFSWGCIRVVRKNR